MDDSLAFLKETVTSMASTLTQFHTIFPYFI